MSDSLNKLADLSGIDPQSLRVIAEQVRENHNRLNGCRQHEFSPKPNADHEASLLSRRFVCKHCQGEIDSSAHHWYQLGRSFKPHIDQIARVCHEVNRSYCEALGDFSQQTWNDAPEWQKDSVRAGVRLHIENPNAGPEASHASWMRQKEQEGWVYGPVKDPDAKQHPCMVPFSELPREQQAKDFIFRSVVHALAHH